tara:strand:- start:66608 stop:71581 length:4974 start_codon:yes stop_codon:yes gene_type:complete
MIRFNRSQRLGLDLDKHIALDAGAGTGKTTVMAERYVQHLLSHEQRATHLLPTGPREPLTGHGSLRSPPRQRTEQKQWRGLLPSEVVAITFTKKAAAELKARIRMRVGQTRAGPILKGDSDGIFDPRVRSHADVEMLLSSLDEAPISTIDAFLSQLVSPHLDFVAVHPSREQISEERSPLLTQEALQSAWRIRTVSDALEAGVRGNVDGFISARNRLAVLLGGQERAAVVLSGMLGKSLFVEEAHHAMVARAHSNGEQWSGQGPMPHEVLLDMFSEPVQDIAVEYCRTLQNLLLQWTDHFLAYSADYIVPCESEIGTSMTRFNHLTHLARQPLPEEPAECIQWVWQIALASASWSQLNSNDRPTFFTKGGLPQANHCNGWHPGLYGKSHAKTLSKAVRDSLHAQAANLAENLRSHMNSRQGTLMRMLGKSAFLLAPISNLPHMPEDCPLRSQPVGLESSDIAPDGRLRISCELQTRVLNDLLLVHRGCQDILALMKAHEGVHDYDDIQRLAADLLLARCPDIVRHTYPIEVVRVLDELGNEPWHDHHIARAMRLAGEDHACYEDLNRRFAVLQTIRRQYRAFIIDEYQDTNPAHFRLLARLWGHRKLAPDDPARPLGPWDPTVCIVGDMKQSIYRFRQAEVTVMRRTVAAIKLANEIESNEQRLSHLRLDDHGRDPRPVGAGGEIGSFIVGTDVHSSSIPSQPWEHVELVFEDDEDVVRTIDDERKNRRSLGHIDLTSNHRTLPNLMDAMNGMFQDVFDPRHYLLPGDWHAEHQRLRAARTSTEAGVLEWLLPLQIDAETPSLDLNEYFDTFSAPEASKTHLENELIAARLQALLFQQPTRMWNASQQNFTEVPAQEKPVRAEDILILVHSRKHIPDLISRLQSRGVPVMADRQGALLSQPVVSPLISCLELIAYPQSRHAALTFARSPILGFNDAQSHALMTQEMDGTWWQKIQHCAPNDSIRRLAEHLEYLVQCGAVHDIFDVILDHSDLLVAYPDDTSRQNAESWCALLSSIGDELGHEASALYHRIKDLDGLGTKGPSAITTPPGGAVQIMTIHGAKGLQAPVVVVAGMFHAGKSDASLAAKNNVLVTPQVVAGRINPWTSRDRPDDGLWEFAKRMDHAQRQAERRREFYVALTRVKDRLIVVGSPSRTAEIDVQTHRLTFKSKPSLKTMGGMWLDGLRSLSHQHSVHNSPWLLQGDVTGGELAAYTETVLSLDPFSLASDSQLGIESLDGIHIYHSPQCFPSVQTQTPLQDWHIVEQRMNALTVTEPDEIPPPPLVNQIMRMPAHSLDSSHSCPRAHWLTEVRGWNPEPLYFFSPSAKRADKEASNYPEATTFGTLMHRLIEIGLENPASKNGPPTSPLPSAWVYDGKDLLDDPEAIRRVMAEEGIGVDGSDDELAQATHNRLAEIGSLVRNGLLGTYAKGEHIHGFSVEGLRTELPFYYVNQVRFTDLHRSGFSVDGPRPLARVDHVDIVFDGRADLVLALRDTNGRGYLQVVDLKTKGCRDEFNFNDPQKGSRLQRFNGELLNPYPSTPAERSILKQHTLQLTLYSLALESMEQQKPESERRTILPPSLLMGASGRMLQMTETEYGASKATFSQHLEWMAQLSATPGTIPEPPAVSSDNAHICSTCPYSRGDIRLCVSDDETLGPRPTDD